MTDRSRLTASKRNLYQHCQYWALPETPWTDTSGAGAEAGSEAHAAFEAVHNGAAHDAPEHARRKAEVVTPVLRELKARGSESWSEIAFAWSPVTGKARVLGVGKGRHYADATDGEVCGTADIVVRCFDGSLLVADWKNRVPGHTVDATAQLRTLALMAARAFGSEDVATLTVLVDENEAERVSGPTLNSFDLDMEESVLCDAVAQLRYSPEPMPGPHCAAMYCPAAASCPATVDALAQTLPAKMLVRDHRLSPVISGPDHAAWSLTAVDLVEEGIKAIKASLRAFADAHNGIPLADGTVWQGSEVTTEKPALDVPGALAEVRAAGADAALDITTSWSAIERAIGKAPAKELRKALAAMGATKTSTHKRYEAKKDRKRAA